MDELRRQVEELMKDVALLRRQLDERDARIAELEAELKRRGKTYRPKANAEKQTKKTLDRRKQPHRKHPSVFREPPVVDENTIDHDVRLECCPHCGRDDLEETGRFDDHLVEDIPKPKIELHRYRRHVQKCHDCGRECQGRGDLALPGAHIGPRAAAGRLQPRSLGHLAGKDGRLAVAVVRIGYEPRRNAGTHPLGRGAVRPGGRETLRHSACLSGGPRRRNGWRIDGKNVWAWCFSIRGWPCF